MASRPVAIWLAVDLCLLLAAAVPAVAETPASPAPAAKEVGELWEHTVQMTGMGMAMPPRTTRSCRPQTALDEPPMADGNRDCELLDVKSSPGKMSWSMRCKGDPPMTGTAEITFQGGDAYQGTMTMKTAQGEMQTKLSGRNLHQECDAGEIKRQAAEIQRTSQDSMKKVCEDGARSMTLALFDGPAAMCKEPGQKAEVCKNFRTMNGFASLPPDPSHPNSRGAVAKFCETTPETLLADLCPTAAAQDAFEFLGHYCPAETRALAERECAGRKYTALQGSKYQKFCADFAADTLAGSKPGESCMPR